ncbi:MAG: glycosyltransferase family 4 protein [Acidimicrobiales bacterium]
MPVYSSVPVGGYAIVYEYANGLQARGHDVTVVHPRPWGGPDGLRAAACRAKWCWSRRLKGRDAVAWFPVRRGVRLAFVPDLRERLIPEGDAIVATAWSTAPAVHGYSATRGRKLYLLQHHETWSGPQEEVDATWRLPLHKIATGRWLADLAAEFGVEGDTTYIPNGVDTGRYRLTVPIEDRPPHRVAMLFHPADWKGVPDGLEALTIVRREFPQLEAVLFGTWPRPDDLPTWVTYLENPHGDELVRLYNSCSVFLHPSWAEGCPLPPAEAMGCGCGLVAAANPGVCDYARDGYNAVLAPIKQPALLAEALARVLRDDALRRRIARQGHEDMQTRTWSACIDAFDAIVAQPLGK